ncbi:MAG: hypothetical protein L6243_05305 [Candidatus Altiarchaeales archaeon]|nr:hypothetical protein [Candidatus Altiarchaeota archaeon]MBU4437854.1 hypothetical protein [Candidatus Altiarchaeota archaeon]MCG2782989.1 hypothetical protein [Candidatus Altiarchaeales archaeon]
MANEEANMGEDWNLEIPSQSSSFFNENQTYGAIGGSKMATEEANMGRAGTLNPRAGSPASSVRIPQRKAGIQQVGFKVYSSS